MALTASCLQWAWACRKILKWTRISLWDPWRGCRKIIPCSTLDRGLQHLCLLVFENKDNRVSSHTVDSRPSHACALWQTASVDVRDLLYRESLLPLIFSCYFFFCGGGVGYCWVPKAPCIVLSLTLCKLLSLRLILQGKAICYQISSYPYAAWEWGEWSSMCCFPQLVCESQCAEIFEG